MDIEQLKQPESLSSDFKPELDFKPEKEIRDNSNNLIEKIGVEIYKGTGLAEGASGIGIRLYFESAHPIEIGLWKIENNRVIPSRGEISATKKETLPGKLQNALNLYFANHPEELKKLKKQLQD